MKYVTCYYAIENIHLNSILYVVTNTKKLRR